MSEEKTLTDLLPRTIQIVLGGKSFIVKEKSIIRMSELRLKICKLIDHVQKSLTNTEDVNPDIMFAKLMLTSGIDDLIDAFFSYCTEIPKSEVENEYSDLEFLNALIGVYELNSPFLDKLWEQMAVIFPKEITE